LKMLSFGPYVWKNLTKIWQFGRLIQEPLK
jgi:hypothetical protein